MVEVTGFEPAASSSRTKRSTKLSHTSIFCCSLSFFFLTLADSFFIISITGLFVNTIFKIFLDFLEGDF